LFPLLELPLSLIRKGLSGELHCWVLTIDGGSNSDGFLFWSTRDALDATMNYGAHSKFVEKWLGILEEEGKTEASAPSAAAESAVPTETADTPAPATTSTAEAPATS